MSTWILRTINFNKQACQVRFVFIVYKMQFLIVAADSLHENWCSAMA